MRFISGGGSEPLVLRECWKESVGGGFSAPTILEQNRIAGGDRLAPPMGELSPQVTERAYTLSGLVNSATSPRGGGKASFEKAG